MVYPTGNGGWEKVGTVRMFVVLLDGQVNGLLLDRHQPDGVFRFWLGENAFSVGVANILLADGDCTMSYFYVTPEERSEVSAQEAG